jgi:hypothetical protein
MPCVWIRWAHNLRFYRTPGYRDWIPRLCEFSKGRNSAFDFCESDTLVCDQLTCGRGAPPCRCWLNGANGAILRRTAAGAGAAGDKLRISVFDRFSEAVHCNGVRIQDVGINQGE